MKIYPTTVMFMVSNAVGFSYIRLVEGWETWQMVAANTFVFAIYSTIRYLEDRS